MNDPTALAGHNLAGIARWAADEFGDTPAIEHENGERLTFVELARRVAGLAEQLAAGGVGPGSRLAVALGSEPATLLLVLAAAEHGAAVLPLNPGFSGSEVEHLFTLVQPTHLVGLDEFRDRHQQVTEQHQVRPLALTRAVAPYDGLGRTGSFDRPVRFGLTSGSTGMPKAVTKTQRNWLFDGRAMSRVLSLAPGDRVLQSQPLYYGDPLLLLMGCLHAGATAVQLSRFRSQTFMEQVATRSITKFVTIGSMPAMLLNTPPSSHDTDHRATLAWSVGVPRNLHAELERRFGVRWLELYGTSECGVALGQRSDTEPEIGQGWLGTPAPDTELRLVDPAGTVLDGDGTGLIEVRGPTVAADYWRTPAASAQAFRADGWYRPGDVLERIGTQYRYLRREKDIVRRAGENISCHEVETTLRQLPTIYDAAVLPRPDDIRGEEVWAFVQLTAPTDTTSQTAQALVAEASQHLARHKLPRFITFVDTFPRTPSERIVKRELLAAADQHDLIDLGERRAPGTGR